MGAAETPRVTFRPPWWATALVVAGVGTCIALGLWQLGRGDEKRALFASFAAGETRSPLAALPGDGELGPDRYRRIELRGRFEPGRQVLLDNMMYDGRVGYHVLTPLRVDAALVLVNRGWVPASPRRDELPEIAIDAVPRVVAGRIDRLPRPGLALDAGPPDPQAPWPRRLSFPTSAQLAAQYGEPVAPWQVLLAPDAPGGFVRDWQPAVSGPDMHLGYAVQWFAFAGAMFAIYVGLNLKRRATETDAR